MIQLSNRDSATTNLVHTKTIRNKIRILVTTMDIHRMIISIEIHIAETITAITRTQITQTTITTSQVVPITIMKTIKTVTMEVITITIKITLITIKPRRKTMEVITIISIKITAVARITTMTITRVTTTITKAKQMQHLTSMPMCLILESLREMIASMNPWLLVAEVELDNLTLIVDNYWVIARILK